MTELKIDSCGHTQWYKPKQESIVSQG
jgi:hypothetical protein